VGLLISWYAATAAGATVAAVSVALFFLVLLGRGVAARRAVVVDR
jgi:ABC-type Mn2+/Zn2+ transport system permease subunit